MKRYIYKKIDQSTKKVLGILNVETDAVANIDNFLVTHVTGELDYQTMIHDGLDINMGVVVEKHKFFMYAVNLNYQVFCFENNVPVANETLVDPYTFDKKSFIFNMQQFNLNVVYDKRTYEMFISTEVKAAVSYEEIKEFLPVVSFHPMFSSYKDGTSGSAGDIEFKMQIEANGKLLTPSTGATVAIQQLASISKRSDTKDFIANLNSQLKSAYCMLFSLPFDFNGIDPKKISSLTIVAHLKGIQPTEWSKTISVNPNTI